MGKGDRKTARGKRYISSYGNARSHVATKAAGTAAAPVVKKAAKAPAKKAAKKTATKKAVKKVAKKAAKKAVRPLSADIEPAKPLLTPAKVIEPGKKRVIKKASVDDAPF